MTVKKILRPRDIIKYGRRDWYYVHLPKLLTGQLYGNSQIGIIREVTDWYLILAITGTTHTRTFML